MKKKVSKSSAERQKEYRERAKQVGMRKVQCWAPDDYSRQLLLDIAAFLRSRKREDWGLFFKVDECERKQ